MFYDADMSASNIRCEHARSLAETLAPSWRDYLISHVVEMADGSTATLIIGPGDVEWSDPETFVDPDHGTIHQMTYAMPKTMYMVIDGSRQVVISRLGPKDSAPEDGWYYVVQDYADEDWPILDGDARRFWLEPLGELVL
jgi:hypothetical protein